MKVQAVPQERLHLPPGGKSQIDPSYSWWVRPLNKLAVTTLYRVEAEGKLPETGAHLICPTHQSMFDASIIGSLTDRDLRYMAAEEQFVGFRGKIMSKVGAYPVDRDHPSPTSLKHSVQLLRDGESTVVFGEGGIKGGEAVHALKPGIGWIATRAPADSVVPVAMHIAPDTKSRPLEKTLGWLASAGVVAGGVAAAFGGPVTRTAVGAATGLLAGAYVGARAARTGEDPFANIFGSARWGALGALAGGTLGAAGAALLPQAAPFLAAPTSVLAGKAVKAVADHFRTRDVVRIEVCEPVAVGPFLAAHGKAKAGEHLLVEVERRLNESKQKLVQQ